jgi:hypothetical protein
MNYIDYLFVFFVFSIFATTVILLQRMQINNEQKKELARLKEANEKLEIELKLKNRDTILPIRLQAYERLILLLERLNPQSMIFRVQKPGMNVLLLQTTLLQNVRQEFEHNLAQQLYVSQEAWAMVKTAKEDLVKLINTAAAKVQPEEEATALSKEIIMLQAERTNQTFDSAVIMLKKEIYKTF